jgi:digeranylgeranylglycerophospholipid reductase
VSKTYDVVVIGAGPSGSVAARLAADQGFKTLLIEKRQEIGTPVRCAETIGAISTKRFIQIDPKWVNAEIDLFRIVNSKGMSARLPPTEKTIIVNRKVFDFELAVLAARAGASIRSQGVIVKSRGGTETIRSRLVVAADGVESQIGRFAGLKTVPARQDYYIAFEYLAGGLERKINPLECEYHLDHSLAPGGYLWIFPKGKDIANIGIVIPSNLTSKYNPCNSLNCFIQKKFPRVEKLAVIAGGIPVSGALETMVTNGLVLVGDAAHQADPLMGGGINLGMIGASLAMQAAIPALLAGDVSAVKLHAYDVLWHQQFGKMHKTLKNIRNILANLNQERLDALVQYASELPVEKLSLSQLILRILVKNPSLLLETRHLISSGLLK